MPAALNDAEEGLIGPRRGPPCTARPSGSSARPPRRSPPSWPAGPGSGRGTSRRRPRAPPGSPSRASGVSSSRLPSRCDRNVTPSSVDPVASRQAEDLEPAGVGQDRTVPAHERVQPAERRHHVLARPERQVVGVGQHHPVPVARSWSGVSPLTVAWVPTGMNAGVSTEPFGVRSREPPRRAPSRGRASLDGQAEHEPVVGVPSRSERRVPESLDPVVTRS